MSNSGRPQPYSGDRMNPTCDDFRILGEVPLRPLDFEAKHRVKDALGDVTFSRYWYRDGSPKSEADSDEIRRVALRRRRELLDAMGAEALVEVRGGRPAVNGPGRKIMVNR